MRRVMGSSRRRWEFSGANVLAGALLVLAAIFAVIAMTTPPPSSGTAPDSVQVATASRR